MFDPGWSEGCPSCSWAVDNLPANMERLADEGIAFAMISQAPIEKLEAWRTDIMDRTCYGRQQDWEDSPEGWPQCLTYG